MQEIWHAGGTVNMIQIGNMAIEEAKLAEGAVIDAFRRRKLCQYQLSAAHLAGLRNLTNAKRGLSYAEDVDFADDRRSFAQIGTHLLSLLHAEALNGKRRVLQPHDYAA